MGKNERASNLGNMQVFAENFRYYLEKSGELKKDLAKHVNISPTTFSDWLNCRTYPRMDRIERLAEHWGITMADLVEKHSVENDYYLEKEAKIIAEEFADDPDAYAIYQAIKKLSPTNKEIVLNLINSLNGGK